MYLIPFFIVTLRVKILVMKIIYNDIFLQHNTGNHPENKNRLLAFGDISQSTIIDGTPYLSLVHNGQYISDVQQKCNLDIPLDHDRTECSATPSTIAPLESRLFSTWAFAPIFTGGCSSLGV